MSKLEQAMRGLAAVGAVVLVAALAGAGGPVPAEAAGNDKITWKAPEGYAASPEAAWEGMKAALLRGDVEGAVRFFSPETQGTYREMFRGLGGDLRKLAQGMRPIVRDKLGGSTAMYHIPRETVLEGRTVSLVFPISFIRAPDGRWLIERF